MIKVPIRDFTLELGARQIALVLFLAVVVMGSFSAMAYIVGRAVLPVSGAPAEEREIDTVGPEKVLVVDPAGEEAPSPAARPEAARVASTADSHFREPSPGQLFLQVAAADRGVAEVFAEYLTRKSFPCQVASGPDKRSYRVLVGPIQDRKELGTIRTGLEASGFNPFPRRYKAN